MTFLYYVHFWNCMYVEIFYKYKIYLKISSYNTQVCEIYLQVKLICYWDRKFSFPELRLLVITVITKCTTSYLSLSFYWGLILWRTSCQNIICLPYVVILPVTPYSTCFCLNFTLSTFLIYIKFLFSIPYIFLSLHLPQCNIAFKKSF